MSIQWAWNELNFVRDSNYNLGYFELSTICFLSIFFVFEFSLQHIRQIKIPINFDLSLIYVFYFYSCCFCFSSKRDSNMYICLDKHVQRKEFQIAMEQKKNEKICIWSYNIICVCLVFYFLYFFLGQFWSQSNRWCLWKSFQHIWKHIHQTQNSRIQNSCEKVYRWFSFLTIWLNTITWSFEK